MIRHSTHASGVIGVSPSSIFFVISGFVRFSTSKFGERIPAGRYMCTSIPYKRYSERSVSARPAKTDQHWLDGPQAQNEPFKACLPGAYPAYPTNVVNARKDPTKTIRPPCCFADIVLPAIYRCVSINLKAIPLSPTCAVHADTQYVPSSPWAIVSVRPSSPSKLTYGTKVPLVRFYEESGLGMSSAEKDIPGLETFLLFYGFSVRLSRFALRVQVGGDCYDALSLGNSAGL